MTRTMIETDTMAAAAGHEGGGSSPTPPKNDRGAVALPLTARAASLARWARNLENAPGGTAAVQMPLLIGDLVAFVQDLADQIERITPYLDETDQGDDDLKPEGTA